MAKVIWNKRAELLFYEHIVYAQSEFGITTALRWINQRSKIIARLRNYPESYSPEKLLKNRKRTYRAAIIMKNFKLIYAYFPTSGTVHIVDLWDMRMNPASLRKRIR